MEQPAIKDIRKPEFKFLYVKHSTDEFDSIKLKLNDVNAIFLEWVADNKTKRLVEEMVYQASLVDDPKIKNRYIEQLSSDDGDNFTTLTIKYAIENKLQLYFIDETPEGEGTLQGQRAQEAFNYTKNSVDDGNFSQAIESYKLFHRYNHKFVKTRDAEVAKQLKKILDTHNLDGLKFAVIQGEMHRGTYRNFSDDNRMRHKRLFDSDRNSFFLESEIIERLERNDQPNVIDDLVKRDFITRFVIQKYNDDNSFYLTDSDIDGIGRRISQEDLELYYKKLFNIEDLTVNGYSEYNRKVVEKQLDIIGNEIIEKYSKNNI